MGNNTNGIKRFTVNDKVYKLQYSLNGLCDLQEALDDLYKDKKLDVIEFFTEMESGKFKFPELRVLFWAGLQEHHEGISIREAGKLAAELGDFTKALELAGEAVRVAFPQDDKADAEGDTSEKAKATA